MTGKRTMGARWRMLLSALLVVAMTIAMTVASIIPAYAVEIQVLDADGHRSLYYGDVYALFTLDPDEWIGRREARPTREVGNVAWAEGAEDVVWNFLSTYSTDPNAGIDYYTWLYENGHTAGPELTYAETGVAKDPKLAALFIADKINDDLDDGYLISTANDTDFGKVAAAIDANSFANALSNAVTSSNMPFVSLDYENNSSVELQDAYQEKYGTRLDGNGFYVLVAPRADNALPIYMPVDAYGGFTVTSKIEQPILTKSVKRVGGSDYDKIADGSVDDEFEFRLDIELPEIRDKSKTNKLQVVDTLPEGLSYVEGSAEYFNNMPQNKQWVTVDGDNGEILFDIVESVDDISWIVSYSYITYRAKLSDVATTGVDGLNVNSAKLIYNLLGDNFTDPKYDGETVSSEASVATYKLKIRLVDADTGESIPLDEDYIRSQELSVNTNGDSHRITFNAEGEAEFTGVDGGLSKSSFTSIYLPNSVPTGYFSWESPFIDLKPTSEYNQETNEITSLAVAVNGGEDYTGAITAEPDLASGIIQVTIPLRPKEGIILPVTGMTASQLGTIVGVVLVVSGGVALAVHRRRSTKAA